MTPESTPMTPGKLADLLGVTDRTVRRMGSAYRGLYGQDALLPDPRHPKHFLFPPEAVDRLQQAAAHMRQRPGLSTTQALVAVRDGVELPARPRLQVQVAARDQQDATLREIQQLRAELADLRRFLISKLGSVSHDAPLFDLPADSEPAPLPETALRPAEKAKRPRLLPKHHDLLSLMEQGHTLRSRPGGRTGRITELHDLYGEKLHHVDPRTLDALERYGMLERTADGYQLTADRILTP